MRHAVRAALREVSAGRPVYAAVSGGADSLALLAGLAFEGPRHDRRVSVLHVDHGLQPVSADQAARVVEQAAALGVTDVHVLRASATAVRGVGPEAAARRMRYELLDAVAARESGSVVCLGHTRDDQAEQVLLGLARGSGARSLAGIPPARGPYRRPLLHLRHDALVEACRQQGLEPWDDPTNDDVALTRNRVRHRVLPMLEAELGPGVTDALARTADLLRTDADLLDSLAADAHARCRAESSDGLSVTELALLPDAVRSRVIRRALVDAGAPANDVSARHVGAVDALVRDWRGQGPVSLPGGLVAVRRCDRLVVEAP